MTDAGAAADLIEQWRVTCERQVDVLRDLFRVHLAIEEPNRKLSDGEPRWICRLRKIGHHVSAIQNCDVDIDAPHVMAPELRAAYRQMRTIWESLPEGDLEETRGEWWATKARNGVLAAYDHPSLSNLLTLTVQRGGFRGGEDHLVYGQLFMWLSYLAYGYGFALQHLAEALDAGDGVPAALSAAIQRIAPSSIPEFSLASLGELEQKTHPWLLFGST